MLHDLRYAIRTLRQNPGFALVAIISLALGIGANAAMFSWADALLLRPLPVPDASGVMMVQSQLRGESISGMFGAYTGMSYPDYVDLRDRNHTFAGLTAAEFLPFGFTARQGVLPQMRFGELVSGNFFRVLDVPMVLGRSFRDDEDRVRGRDGVAVLGYEMWQKDLGASRDVIGRTIFLDGIAFTVIGVAPQSFLGSNQLVRSALYVPIAMAPRLANQASGDFLEKRGTRDFNVRGRLKPGVSVDQATAEALVIATQLGQTYPETNRTCSFQVATDTIARLRRSPYDAAICAFLMALAIVVLLIACANVMNLMLSRARARAREIAVRLAIGAGRSRLIRLLLTESLVIAVLGGALGLVVAQFGVDLFSRFRIPSAIPITFDVRLDPRVLMVALLVSVVSAILFGLAPALQSSNPQLVPALKSGKSGGGKRHRFLGRNALVIAQVAGSLVLLVFATQTYRGAAILLSNPAGFRIDHLLVANLDPTLARYSPPQTQEFYRRLLEKIRALPGVKSAALSEDIPMGVNGGATRVAPEGFQLAPGTQAVPVLSNVSSEGYFETMGVPIVEGREFRETDRADSTKVVIVNELFASKYYPNGSAIGKRMRLDGPQGTVVEIVGVAKQSKYSFIAEFPIPFLYLPLSQHPVAGLTLMLETAGPPGEMAGPLRDTVKSLDAAQPVFGILTMEEFFGERATKMLSMLIQTIAGLGLLGLLLALVGLYGLMTYSVGLRQREIGIRMAVGADQRGVLWLVLKHGLLLAGIGVALGAVGSLLAGGPVTGLLEIHGFNMPLFAAVAVALMVAAALGAYIPARRASRLDPNLVLRQE